MFDRRAKPRRINLALPGVGVHGAFTWGVLDRLLREESLDITWISGTSAGAVNAVAMAHGLAQGGLAHAIQTLHDVWDAVVEAQVPDLVKLNPFMAGLVRSSSVSKAAPVLSPYEFNPLNLDPFRRILTRHIDFETIRTQHPCELLIAATDVATGLPRVFRTDELSVEVVLASACLPMLHQAVVIDGRAYWDGGFSANPDILTLASHSPADDTVIVQLNPTVDETPPRTLAEISDRAQTIAFNQGYLRDLAEIARAKRGITNSGHAGHLRRHRFHLIEAARHTAHLHMDTKIKADRDLVAYLFNAGRGEAHKWLDRNGDDIGRKNTMVFPDLRALM